MSFTARKPFLPGVGTSSFKPMANGKKNLKNEKTHMGEVIFGCQAVS
jgi:hypothetical protein